VTGGRREDDLVAEQHLERDGAVAARKADDAHLEGALGDQLDDTVRVGDGECDAQVGVRALQLPEHERDNRPARTGRRAELEPPADPILLRELVEQLLLEREHPLRVPVEAQAGLRRLDAAARAVEQLRPEALLERADLQADGRLGDTEALRGLGEALLLDDGAERGELTRVHKHSGDYVLDEPKYRP